MKIKRGTKREILTSSFDTLKGDLMKNYYEIGDILGELIVLDKDYGVERWKWVLEHAPKQAFVDTDVSYSFHEKIIYHLEHHMSDKKVAEIIYDDGLIEKSIFQYSAANSCLDYRIVKLLRNGLLEKADSCINMMFLNKNKELTYGKFLAQILHYLKLGKEDGDKEITEETFRLLTKWVKRTESPTELAGLNAQLVSLLDVEN